MSAASPACLPHELAPGRGFAALLARPNLRGARVLVRLDLNLPYAPMAADGAAAQAQAEHARFARALPTMQALVRAGARVGLLSHFGRPAGRVVPRLSLKPLTNVLARALDCKIGFAPDCVGAAAEEAMGALKPGGILLLENTRFHGGEEANAPEFVAALQRLGDMFVLDAFSVAHREHASSCGLARALPSYAGPNIEQEWQQLERLLAEPTRPFCAIVGGAKIANKLPLLERLVHKCDCLILGGGMANSFLYAAGHAVGRSLHEPELAADARRIAAAARDTGCALMLPHDVVIAPNLAEPQHARTVALADMPADAMIPDCGPESLAQICARLDGAKTCVWNGPLGAFETPPFDTATLQLARHMGARARQRALIAVAGGGDSLAALQHAGCAQDFSYVSTAGGAFLAWLQNRSLPALRALTS